eukprot:836132-Pyramimonas_sp.AAC.2
MPVCTTCCNIYRADACHDILNSLPGNKRDQDCRRKTQANTRGDTKRADVCAEVYTDALPCRPRRPNLPRSDPLEPHWVDPEPRLPERGPETGSSLWKEPLLGGSTAPTKLTRPLWAALKRGASGCRATPPAPIYRTT